MHAQEFIRKGFAVLRRARGLDARTVQELGREPVLVAGPERAHRALQVVEPGPVARVIRRLHSLRLEEHEEVVPRHMVLALVVHPVNDNAAPRSIVLVIVVFVALRILLQPHFRDIARGPGVKRRNGEVRDETRRWNGLISEVERRLDVLVPAAPNTQKYNGRSESARSEVGKCRGHTAERKESTNTEPFRSVAPEVMMPGPAQAPQGTV